MQAPLEQFKVIPLVKLQFLIFDFSITNFLIIEFLIILFIVIFIFFNKPQIIFKREKTFFFFSNSWQKIFELILEITTKLVSNLILINKKNYLPLLLMILNFILFSNLISLIPYTFTSTAHLFITFSLSFSVFLGINLEIFKNHHFKTFGLFIPKDTSFFLALVLVPLEIISHLIKPISLGARLFINLMAGHTLLKVILGFAWEFLLLENSFSIAVSLPLLTLIILFILELAVSFIQTYVFITLTCIYIQEGN